MLYREITAVSSEIHTKHINTLCGQNGELMNVKLVCFYNRRGVYCAVRTGSSCIIQVMCFVWVREQAAIISPYSINWLVCITEMESVYCAVRTGSLCIIQVFHPVRLFSHLVSLHDCSILVSMLLLPEQTGEGWGPFKKPMFFQK
jgi:hypothetical protein